MKRKWILEIIFDVERNVTNRTNENGEGERQSHPPWAHKNIWMCCDAHPPFMFARLCNSVWVWRGNQYLETHHECHSNCMHRQSSEVRPTPFKYTNIVVNVVVTFVRRIGESRRRLHLYSVIDSCFVCVRHLLLMSLWCGVNCKNRNLVFSKNSSFFIMKIW